VGPPPLFGMRAPPVLGLRPPVLLGLMPEPWSERSLALPTISTAGSPAARVRAVSARAMVWTARCGAGILDAGAAVKAVRRRVVEAEPGPLPLPPPKE